MEFKKRVQFLVCEKTNNDLFRYDFLDLESNLPFSVFSTSEVENYKTLKQYFPTEVTFNLLLVKQTDKNGSTKILWKIKAV